jgi:PAS domain S-box-containing protein
MSEIRYRRLFEAAQDGILLLNAQTGDIEDANPFLTQMLGYSHDELLGRKLWEVGAFADVAKSTEMFERLQAEGYVRYDDLPLNAGWQAHQRGVRQQHLRLRRRARDPVQHSQPH